jgi:hypothetical protein
MVCHFPAKPPNLRRRYFPRPYFDARSPWKSLEVRQKSQQWKSLRVRKKIQQWKIPENTEEQSIIGSQSVFVNSLFPLQCLSASLSAFSFSALSASGDCGRG